MTDLHALADSVADEASFVLFLQPLAADWQDERAKEAVTPSSPYGPGVNGWENGSIGDFLESAAAWSDALKPGLPAYNVPPNAWRRCAHILLAGNFSE